MELIREFERKEFRHDSWILCIKKAHTERHISICYKNGKPTYGVYIYIIPKMVSTKTEITKEVRRGFPLSDYKICLDLCAVLCKSDTEVPHPVL